MYTSINLKRFQFYLWVGVTWLLLWIFVTFMNNDETFVPQTINEIWRFFYILIANLIFFEFSLPFILKKRSFILFNILIGIPLLAIHFILLSFGLYCWKLLGVHLEIYTNLRQATIIPNETYYRVMEEVSYQAQGGITSFFFFGIAQLFHYHFKLKQTTQQLQLKKKEAELNYLKSQMNPHFLFNTLNNIYSLAKDKSDLAPESILRLSKILRFMLNETSSKFINIEQEVEIITDYIALEKLRYDESLHINFTQDIDNLKLPLTPLLLIPLVENAFKHGVSETSNLPFIDIYLSVKRQQLLFVVKNSIEKYHEDMIIKENIGLTNLRRQLELLYKEYDLSVLQDETEFSATLKINVTSYD